MADAGVARDPGRLPWLEPYRAPQRRTSNRRTGFATLMGVGGLCAVVALLVGDLVPGASDQEPTLPQTRIVLPAPAELQPEIVLPPLRSREAPPAAVPEAARLVHPASRPERREAALPERTAAPDLPVDGLGDPQSGAGQLSEAASAIAALPLPPDPPRPAVDPSAKVVRGRTVQLGVYLTAQQAEAAWQKAIRDYTFLVTMPKDIEPITIRSKRFYRLQLGTPSKQHARQFCRNLKTIGRACTVA